MELGFEVQGLFGIIALILYIWAILNIAQAYGGALGKALWVVFLLFVPFIGFLIWFFFGPRSAQGRRRAGY